MRENFPVPAMRILPTRAMHKDLFGPKIEAALAGLPEGASPLKCLDLLRRAFEPELARQIAQLHDWRQRCKPRIGLGLVPYLRGERASQMSAPAIARYRAQHMRASTPASHIWDCTCGLGMDAIHMAQAAFHGFPGRVFCGDATRQRLPVEGLLIDPDRRAQGQRSLDPSAWSPSLERSLELAQAYRAAAIKLPPVWGVPPDWRARYHVEWISVGGELLECCLWLGEWATRPGFQAVRLDRDGGAQRFAGEPTQIDPLPADEAENAAYLFDPDPSLAAAGLLERFARVHGLAPMAPKLGYLGGDVPPPNSMGQAFRILDRAPLRPGPVKKMLADHDIGPLHVRMRGHRERPEDLARRLAGPGARRGHIAVARLEVGRRVLLLEPLA